MTPSQLRAFLAVARHRGFSAAARALGVSQPTLTTQVQSLEREHNVELFFRRGRRVDLPRPPSACCRSHRTSPSWSSMP
jgi:DNA-binding transcriptional LysR family regulator